MPPLSLNHIVRIHEKNNWISKGKVIRKCDQPRSYEVPTQKGSVLRCNRRHLLKTIEPFEKDCAIDYDDIVINDHTQPQTTVLPTSKIIQPSKIPQEQTSLQQDKEPVRIQYYKTRSGRLIKPPSKLNL